jgi:hypothetical protein
MSPGTYQTWATGQPFGLSYRSEYIYLRRIPISAALINL